MAGRPAAGSQVTVALARHAEHPHPVGPDVWVPFGAAHLANAPRIRVPSGVAATSDPEEAMPWNLEAGGGVAPAAGPGCGDSVALVSMRTWAAMPWAWRTLAASRSACRSSRCGLHVHDGERLGDPLRPAPDSTRAGGLGPMPCRRRALALPLRRAPCSRRLHVSQRAAPDARVPPAVRRIPCFGERRPVRVGGRGSRRR